MGIRKTYSMTGISASASTLPKSAKSIRSSSSKPCIPAELRVTELGAPVGKISGMVSCLAGGGIRGVGALVFFSFSAKTVAALPAWRESCESSSLRFFDAGTLAIGSRVFFGCLPETLSSHSIFSAFSSSGSSTGDR